MVVLMSTYNIPLTYRPPDLTNYIYIQNKTAYIQIQLWLLFVSTNDYLFQWIVARFPSTL